MTTFHHFNRKHSERRTWLCCTLKQNKTQNHKSNEWLMNVSKINLEKKSRPLWVRYQCHEGHYSLWRLFRLSCDENWLKSKKILKLTNPWKNLNVQACPGFEILTNSGQDQDGRTERVQRNPRFTYLDISIQNIQKSASDLAKISGDPQETPRGGSPGGLRTISAGTTLLVHMVCYFRVKSLCQETLLAIWKEISHVCTWGRK